MVLDVVTNPPDAVHRPAALGLTRERLKAEQPHIFALLKTEIKACIIGYSQNSNVYLHLPPQPPDVHDFVYAATADQIIALTGDFDFLRLLIATPSSIPPDELIAAAVREAAKAKDLIVQIGVNDAFVSAYINGKRIPMEQAAAMEAQQGKAVFAQIQGMNVQPKTIPIEGTIQQRTTVAQETKVVTPVAPNNTPVNIVYKVQLGAFKNEVPVEIMNKYLTIADKGIANFKSGDLTIYTVGNFKDAASAEAIKAEVIAKGIADAFVIALNNGEKITLEDAKKLGGK